MTSIFRPKISTPAPPPPPPQVDQAVLARQTSDLARRRRGIAANQIAGDVGSGSVASPVLGGG